MTEPREYDVIVIGAGPAGAAAANWLAQKKYEVALIDGSSFPKEDTRVGWLNEQVTPLLSELDVPVKSLLNHAIENVTFINKDFSKTAKPQFKDAPGYLIDRTELGNMMVQSATNTGVDFYGNTMVTRLQPEEKNVTIKCADDSEMICKLLVLASGRNSTLPEQVGFLNPSKLNLMWTGQIDIPIPKDKFPGELSVSVVLGLDSEGSFAMSCISDHGQSVSINWSGEKDNAIPVLANVCNELYRNKYIVVPCADKVSEVHLHASPVAAAIDLESHVGKHSLLIGDAGGFLSAASNEGIFPAIWSAKLASELVDEAIQSGQSQDILMQFDSKWRIAMAEYLRSPNTDVQFLLPLIFSNQPMADKMGLAFFTGENI